LYGRKDVAFWLVITPIARSSQMMRSEVENGFDAFGWIDVPCICHVVGSYGHFLLLDLFGAMAKR